MSRRGTDTQVCRIVGTVDVAEVKRTNEIDA